MLKRVFDFVVAAILLCVAAPVLLIVALLVRMFLGAGFFFSQQRPGLHGRPFRLWKFRTMTDARDPAGNLLSDEVRLTRFGIFLRSTSLDELPQLFNVLRGDISLVGPRPLLMDYLPLYSPTEARRHEVRPGITGWAQVNGRNAISWRQKFEYDVWYVDHQSFMLDMKILLMTARRVFLRSQINAGDHPTMTRFLGTDRMEDHS